MLELNEPRPADEVEHRHAFFSIFTTITDSGSATSLGDVFLTSAAQRRGPSTWKNSRTLKPSRIRFRISCPQPTTRVVRPGQPTEGGPIMETFHHLGDLRPDAGAWVFAQAVADPQTSASPRR